MKISSFISQVHHIKPSYESLKENGLPFSLESDWSIQKNDRDFDAYYGEIFQLIYCTDGFQGVPQVDFFLDIEETDRFYVFGRCPANDSRYGIHIMNDSIAQLKIDEDEIDNFGTINSSRFLDAFFEVLKLEKRKILGERKWLPQSPGELRRFNLALLDQAIASKSLE